MKFRPGKETLFLFAILLSAFSVRFLFWRFGYLYGGDPYFHYGNYRDLAESGHVMFPLGLYSPALLLNFILNIFGVSDYDTFRITTPITSILTIFVTYLLTKEVFGIRTAYFSAIILALTPTFISRTMVGSFRGDPYSYLFIIICFYLFVLLIKDSPDIRKKTVIALLGGISLAFSAFVWSSGFIFGAILISSTTVFMSLKAFIKGEENQDNIVQYIIIIGTSLLVIYSFNSLGILYKSISQISGLSDFSELIFPVIVLLVVFLELSRIKLLGRGEKNRLILALGAGILFLFALLILKPGLLEKFENLYRPRYGTGSLQTVGELAPVNMDLLVYFLGIIPVIAVIGAFALLIKKRHHETHIFLIIWLLAGTYVMIKIGARGTFIASIPYAIFAGFGITYIDRLLRESRAFQKIKRYRLNTIIIGILLIFIAANTIFFTLIKEPFINDHWNDALAWENENLPEDSVVLSWWEYGYFISALGHGRTIIDPGQNQARIREVADIFFEEDEKKVQEFLAKYQVDYIIISTELTFQIKNIQTIRGTPKTRNSVLFDYFHLPYIGKFNNGGILYDNYYNQLYVRTQNGRIIEGIVQEGGFYSAHIYYPIEDMLSEFQDKSLYAYNKGVFFVANNQTYLPMYNTSRFAIYIPNVMEKNFITSLLFFQGKNFEDTLELIYINPQIRIYKAKYDGNLTNE